MNYYEVKIYTSPEGIEPLSGVLTMLGHDTFITEDPSVVDDFLEKKNQYDWDYVDEEVLLMGQGESNITVYMETDENAMHQIQEIRAAVAKLKEDDPQGIYGSLRVEDRLVCDDDWKDRWKQYFKPARITDTIVVKPSWEEYEPQEGDKIIEIDPGMAFGTGTHPTTKCVSAFWKNISKAKRISFWIWVAVPASCPSRQHCAGRRVSKVWISIPTRQLLLWKMQKKITLPTVSRYVRVT